MNFYSFVKGDYRFEIKLDWHKEYTSYEPIIINFIDCGKEWWGESLNALMWIGQNTLHTFNKPITQSMFINICEQYEV